MRLDGAAVFRFVLALLMAPLVWGVGRRLRFPRSAWAFAAAYVFTVVSYAADLIDDFITYPAPNTVQHAAYVLVAFSILVAALLARTDVADAAGPA